MTKRTEKFLCMQSVMEHLGALRQEWQDGAAANPKILVDAMQRDLKELERLCSELESIPRPSNNVRKRRLADCPNISAYVGKVLGSWTQPNLSA